MTAWQFNRTRGRRAGALAALAAVFLAGIARSPAAASLEEPARLLAAAGTEALEDHELVALARRLVARGSCGAALDTVDLFFGRSGRNRDLDLEAALLRDVCRAGGARTSGPSSPAPAAAQRPRLNAVQAFVFRSASLEQIPAELRELKASGFDTVIVRTFQNPGDRPLLPGLAVTGPGVYFLTTEAPVAADLLAGIVRHAHALDLRVLAWVATRSSDWLIARHPEWLEYQYDFDLGRSLPARGLSVFQEGFRRTMKSMMLDLAATGVDGVLFQDDLAMRHNEGFSGLAKERFLLETGRGIHPGDLFIDRGPRADGKRAVAYQPLFWEWCRWKSRALLSFADELVRAARAVNPGFLASANVYYESILKPESGLAWFAQDVRGLLERDFDFLALMSYHRQMRSELELDDAAVNLTLEEMARKSRDLAVDESRIIFKIQTYDWEGGRPIPAAEWQPVRDFLRRSGRWSLAVLQN